MARVGRQRWQALAVLAILAVASAAAGTAEVASRELGAGADEGAMFEYGDDVMEMEEEDMGEALPVLEKSIEHHPLLEAHAVFVDGDESEEEGEWDEKEGSGDAAGDEAEEEEVGALSLVEVATKWCRVRARRIGGCRARTGCRGRYRYGRAYVRYSRSCRGRRRRWSRSWTKSVGCRVRCPRRSCSYGGWRSASGCICRGSSSRGYRVLRRSTSNGRYCRATRRNVGCSCPRVNCAVSGWGGWSGCSKTCGGGLRTRTRRVLRRPSRGGRSCPRTKETVPCNVEECPAHCAVSGWGGWSSCTAKCGGGKQVRRRTVTTWPDSRGTPCPALMDERVCNTPPCKVHCRVSAWSAWGHCSKPCGGGTRERKRKALQLPAAGGTACPALVERVACNNVPCAKHCRVGDWAGWSKCSADCGGGTQIRRRPVVAAPAHGGETCPALTETRTCNTQRCAPVGCAVSPWGTWSRCSHSCGVGEQERRRFVTVHPRYDGASCPSTSEKRSCQTRPCPIDCKLRSWASWSECSAMCNGGTRVRRRSVEVHPQFGGAPCGPLVASDKCNTHTCPPVNCAVSEWGNWGNCSEPCGPGAQKRSREVVVSPAYRGSACPTLSESKECNLKTCPVDCKVGEWTTWGACTAECNGGTQARTRSVTQPTVAAGAPCPELRETRQCNKHKCPPVDCEVTAWGEWTDCSRECGRGNRTRVRAVVETPKYGGEECPALAETESCEVKPCPVDCRVGNWSSPGDCSLSCGGGLANQTREVLQMPLFGGVGCPALQRSVPCNTARCPLNCKVSPWSDWTPCSSQCGGGERRRSRSVEQRPETGGAACPALEAVEKCNTQGCPVDCKMGPWAAWGNCTAECGGGLQVRHRRVEVEPDSGGSICPNTSETRRCQTQPCPVHCRVGQWTPWSNCSLACGGGVRRRARPLLQSPRFGGTVCPALNESLPCNTEACPVDCQVGPWTPWSMCSKECDGGNSTRTRSVLRSSAHGGGECPALRESKQCNTHRCPEDCVVGAWTAWSNCSEWCGAGNQSRSLPILKPASHGGELCPNVTQETRQCNLRPCPRHCKVSDWSSWTACSQECGPGVQNRSRLVKEHAAHGGDACPLLKERKTCEDKPCPIDCRVSEWSRWSSCDPWCGDGVQNRSRTVLVADDHSGKPCPLLKESRPCNARPCPVDCRVGPWRNATQCTTICGPGWQLQKRPVAVEAAFGGEECPALGRNRTCAGWDCARPVLTSKCSSHDSCAACVSDAECGWTPSLGKCLLGDERGPTPMWTRSVHYLPDPFRSFRDMAGVHDWHYSYCVGEDCDAYSTCSACAGDPLCGWCGGSESCMKVNKDIGTAEDGQCSMELVFTPATPADSVWQRTGVLATQPRPTPEELTKYCDASGVDRVAVWREIVEAGPIERPRDTCAPCSGEWPNCVCTDAMDTEKRMEALRAADSAAASSAAAMKEEAAREEALKAAMKEAESAKEEFESGATAVEGVPGARMGV